MRSHLFPIAIVLSLASCHQAERDSVSSLRWVQSANPIADAKAAIANGNRKLKGIYGLTLMIPGTDRSKYEEYRSQFGIDPIEGTSDARESAEHGRLIEMAYAYAETYNRQILSTPRSAITPAK